MYVTYKNDSTISNNGRSNVHNGHQDNSKPVIEWYRKLR